MSDDQRYWDAEIETAPLEKLALLLDKAYEKSALYRWS